MFQSIDNLPWLISKFVEGYDNILTQSCILCTSSQAIADKHCNLRAAGKEIYEDSKVAGGRTLLDERAW